MGDGSDVAMVVVVALATVELGATVLDDAEGVDDVEDKTGGGS